jgi:hypothetical protein
MRLQLGRQIIDAAGRFGNGKLAVVDRGDAAAIVAAVFETAQTLDKKIDCLIGPNVSNDATHGESVLLSRVIARRNQEIVRLAGFFNLPRFGEIRYQLPL